MCGTGGTATMCIQKLIDAGVKEDYRPDDETASGTLEVDGGGAA